MLQSIFSVSWSKILSSTQPYKIYSLTGEYSQLRSCVHIHGCELKATLLSRTTKKAASVQRARRADSPQLCSVEGVAKNWLIYFTAFYWCFYWQMWLIPAKGIQGEKAPSSAILADVCSSAVCATSPGGCTPVHLGSPRTIAGQRHGVWWHTSIYLC